MYKNIYDKNPKIEDLERFIKDIELAKELKVDKNDDKSVWNVNLTITNNYIH